MIKQRGIGAPLQHFPIAQYNDPLLTEQADANEQRPEVVAVQHGQKQRQHEYTDGDPRLQQRAVRLRLLH